LAIKADELGYDSFLVLDHFILPRTNRNIDAWTFLPYLAAKTEKIRLGTCVTPIPLRPPAILAKIIASADVRSNARVILGAGVGWHKPEFDGFSKWLEDRERVAYTREALDLITKLWTQDKPVNYEGKYVSSKGGVIEPKPVQKPYPQIWFGAHSPYTLKLTGRYGRGWIPVGPRWFGESYTKPEEYSEMKKVILQKLKKRNIPERDFVFSILINTADTKTLRSEVEHYIDAGMNYFILGESRAKDESTALKDIKRVANEIGRSL
jgi:alkanesulfonate monooxygenase SsuD/methylene tetrahydromethanopterin reductase-like flavin-dependent oxidoreductase (luciferase family)